MYLQSLALVASTLLLGTARSARISARDIAIRDFEESYLAERQWDLSNTTIKLFGFARLLLNGDEADELKRSIAANPAEWAEHQRDGSFFDHEEQVVRVYFPVRDALVYHGSELVEANHLGELPHDSVDGDLAIVGRYQSREVHGDASNTVRDGKILLNKPNRLMSKRGAGNTYIYDFGFRPRHDHGHDHDERDLEERKGGYKDGLFDKNNGCYKNHGNKVCSIAIKGVATGRCGKVTKSTKDCVDYNGFPVSKCATKSKVGFVGSDCYNAVKKGYCWNESRDYVCRMKSLPWAIKMACKAITK